VEVEVVEASHYPLLARRYGVMAVPKVVLNDAFALEGALPPAQFARWIAGALGGEKGAAGGSR
jgi:predicted DsbA family dithiol-disulfide isomerase